MSRALLSPLCILLSRISHSFFLSHSFIHTNPLIHSTSHSWKHASNLALSLSLSLEWVTTARHLVLSISASYFPQNSQSLVRIVRQFVHTIIVTHINVSHCPVSMELGEAPGERTSRGWTLFSRKSSRFPPVVDQTILSPSSKMILFQPDTPPLRLATSYPIRPSTKRIFSKHLQHPS